ncbi:MAG TPA: hypothetical protein EYP49_13700 [Anaerolineae bacterium]|nr:hypothetical protein [Anaerolineae bacterium]
MQSEKLTWKDVVADALRELGGQAHLSEINKQVEGHPKTTTNPTWRDTIRRVVRQYKIFEPVPPDRSGIYRLVELETPQPKSQSLDTEDIEINHGIAQGMLVTLGNIYGYETFVPAYDQTVREFQGKSLGDLVTIKDVAGIFRGPNLSKIREIDALWFDEDDYGLFPVYAFEVEHTTRIKNGLDRLLKIPRRFQVHLFVVAPSEEEQSLFDRFVSQTPFRNYRDRFTFRLYSQLQDVYNAAIKHKIERESFGLIERYRKV